MEPTALPQLSSYLPTASFDTSTSTMNTTDTGGIKKRRNSIEGAFSAVSPGPPTSHQLENDELKRKQPPPEVSVEDNSSKTAPFSRLSTIYQAHEQGSPLVMSKGFSFSSTSSSQGGDVETTSYFTSQPTTPRRERTSRYLSEGDRREIITRIDAGEKQVALAREFSVSRAAICNLYKNRWEVLTRGSRNPESKHPKTKRSCSKRSSPPRLTPQPAANDEDNTVDHVPEPITVYPDVSSITITTDESPREDTPLEGYVEYRSRHEGDESKQNSSPVVRMDLDQEGHTGHHHQLERHQDQRQPSSIQDEASTPVAPRPFLVHEASAYSYPCRNLVAALRDESIGTVVFQQRAMRLARLLVEEVLTCLPHEDVQIKNQFGDVCHATRSLDERDVFGVSMENKGMLLLRAFSTISPASPTGVISIEARTVDDKSYSSVMASTIHAQLPPVSTFQVVLLLDIECATGNEACAVLQHLVHERQIPPKSIYFVTVISSFEGLQNVFQHFPDVTLIAGQVDTVLDANQRIRPGIGDFMQRYWNVHTDPSAP
ncbi:hypothetical protein V7S43_000612 [Phytophthora oleae]|uniref:Phosphoribosyltransferase domain-containing protein n=1 Tax=Phytophthora oleae TaxID=2107226 RepID=A0ABD3G681_9STRA